MGFQPREYQACRHWEVGWREQSPPNVCGRFLTISVVLRSDLNGTVFRDICDAYDAV